MEKGGEWHVGVDNDHGSLSRTWNRFTEYTASRFDVGRLHSSLRGCFTLDSLWFAPAGRRFRGSLCRPRGRPGPSMGLPELKETQVGTSFASSEVR
jgi:hypothetical protein